jgi:hypothetical protein
MEDFTDTPNKELTKEQKAARRAAKKGEYTDRNLDGIPDRDQLDLNVLGDEWQWVRNLIAEIPEINEIFEQAVAVGAFESQAGIQNFINDVIDSDWYKTNDAYARQAFIDRSTDPETYATTLDGAREQIRIRASEIGAQLEPQDIEALANRYVVEGWGQDGRDYLLDRALSDKIGMATGEDGQQYLAGNVAENLRTIAINNGLSFGDEFYLSAAKSVASGLRTEEDFLRDMREQAASYWPAYGDQIRAGVDARSLLGGYINIMSRTLEIDPNSIMLDDPYLRKATTMLDDKGNPRPQSLWEFQQDLRNDPRWINTDQAVKAQVDIGANILRRFGML